MHLLTLGAHGWTQTTQYYLEASGALRHARGGHDHVGHQRGEAWVDGRRGSESQSAAQGAQHGQLRRDAVATHPPRSAPAALPRVHALHASVKIRPLVQQVCNGRGVHELEWSAKQRAEDVRSEAMITRQ